MGTTPRALYLRLTYLQDPLQIIIYQDTIFKILNVIVCISTKIQIVLP